MMILIPICWLRTFKYIAYLSLFANVSIIFALVVILSYSGINMGTHPELHQDLNYFHMEQLPLFFGVAVFNFEGNGLVLNLQASMKEPVHFFKILKRVIILIITQLVIFATFAYIGFGNEIEDMVTLNLPHDSLTSLVQLFYSLGLLCTYPM